MLRRPPLFPDASLRSIAVSCRRRVQHGRSARSRRAASPSPRPASRVASWTRGASWRSSSVSLRRRGGRRGREPEPRRMSLDRCWPMRDRTVLAMPSPIMRGARCGPLHARPSNALTSKTSCLAALYHARYKLMEPFRGHRVNPELALMAGVISLARLLRGRCLVSQTRTSRNVGADGARE